MVNLPLPMGPVTRIMLRSSRASVPTTSGKPRSSDFGNPNGMKRVAIEAEPRCRNVLTRNALLPAYHVGEVRLPVLLELLKQRLQHDALTRPSVSASCKASFPSKYLSRPYTRTAGGAPSSAGRCPPSEPAYSPARRSEGLPQHQPLPPSATTNALSRSYRPNTDYDYPLTATR